MKTFTCEDCKSFNWQQAAKMWGHPCDIHGLCTDFDICGDFSPKDKTFVKDECGCLHSGLYGWNPRGVACGTCLYKANPDCEKRELRFFGLDENWQPIIGKGE